MPGLLAIAASLAAAGCFALLGIGVSNIYSRLFLPELQAQQGQESFLTTVRRLILRHINAFNGRLFSRKYLARVERGLLRAGSPSELSAVEFVGLQELACLATGAFGMLLWATVSLKLVWALVFFVLGWFYPWIWLNDQLKKRQHLMIRALPYNLDLLTLSVEAGLDFAQALGKVVEKGRQGPLVEEFRLVLKNIKLGKTREEALKGLAERVSLPAVTSFANSLIQADKMGTSLGKVLRIQSTQLRIDRTNRAEKLANEAPVKMLFPLIACIFPTVFMILFGPLIFQAITGFE